MSESVDPTVGVELSTLETLPSQNGPRNHRTCLSQNDESRSLQEPVIVEQQQPGCDSCATTLKGSSTVVEINTKLKRCCRIVIVCVVIAAVWGVLTLPIIFHNLDLGQDSLEANMCTSENYTGSICREVLQVQQSCLPDRNTTNTILIATDPTTRQLSKEEEAVKLIEAILSQSPTSKCVEELIPFLCFYIFPLCDSSGRLYQPSSVDCSAIVTNGTCANEIEIVTNLITEDECQVLPEISTTLKCNVTDDLSTVLEDLVETVNATNFNSSISPVERVCSDGFYINESSNLCVPECGVWMELPSSKSTALDVVGITSAVVYLVSGTAVVVLSCIKHKRMFSFPTIFIVYAVIPYGVPELLRFIGYIDRTSLYCSSRDLLTSIMNETLFCTVQGLLFTYTILVQNLFWFFHIIILFGGIKFPFHAKRFETRGYSKYIHIAMVVLALFLPCGHMAAVIATGGVTILSFPPDVCVARETKATLYSFLSPICIINGVGILLLLLIMWSLIAKLWKQQKQAKISGVKEVNSISTAKIKVQLVLLYFLIITLFTLPTLSFSALVDPNSMERLLMYFECESQGIQPGRTCERMFDRSTNMILNAVNFILYGLFPVVSLIFVINFHETKRKILRCLNGSSNHRACRE